MKYALIIIEVLFSSFSTAFLSDDVLEYADTKIAELKTDLYQHIDTVSIHSQKVKNNSENNNEIKSQLSYPIDIDGFDKGLCKNFRKYFCSSLRQDVPNYCCGSNNTITHDVRLIRGRREFGEYYFYAMMDGTENSPSTHHMLHYDNVKLNNGQVFDKYIGAFVAPSTGTYVFTWSISIQNKRSLTLCTNLIVNAAVYGILFTNSYYAYEKDTGFVVAELEKGDVAFIRTCTGTSISGDILSDGDLHASHFAGWML